MSTQDGKTRDRRQTKRYGEYHRDKARYSQRRRRRERLRDAVSEANRAIARNDYSEAGGILRDVILPAIRNLSDAKPMSRYHRELNDDDEYPWHWSAFSKFKENPDHYVTHAQQEPADDPELSPQVLTNDLTGTLTESGRARAVIERALDTAESITAYHELTNDGLAGEADAMGFSCKLGVHQQDYEMDFGDPVSAISTDWGAIKHLYTGGTNGGKSVAADRQLEDYYQSSVTGGRKFKCIDPVGLSEENIAAYDCPQDQNDLQHARENHDLPPSFADIDEWIDDKRDAADFDPERDDPADDPAPESVLELQEVDYSPKAEIYIPLSAEVPGTEFSFDTDTDEWVPTPFTIPASRLSEGLLSSIISERVSDKENETIRAAYRSVDKAMDDWSLADLADEIKDRDELSDNHKKSALRVLENLQDEGFIRTKACEHTLDWDEIMHSTDTVTIFNQSPLQSTLAQYISIAYLVDEVWQHRIQANNYPRMAIRLRELWEFVPHRGQRRKLDDAQQAVIEHIIRRLTAILRKPRDLNTHIIADTQNPKDIEKAIREMFNRYVLFGGVSDTITKDVFSWVGQSGWRSLQNTLQNKPGVGGIVGVVEPAVGDSNIWGISPVELTPASWHSHDKNEIISAWRKRIQILDNGEELRTCDWDASVPDNLEIPEMDDEDDESDGSDEEEEKYTKAAMRAQHRAEARKRYKKGESLRQIADNIDNNPETERSYYASTISEWVNDLEKGEGADDEAE